MSRHHELDREGFLVAHGASGERWAQRYGLQPFIAPCSTCGDLRTTSIPFSSGQLRGLIAPKCQCGEPNPPYCVVRDPRFGDLFTGGEP